MNVLITGGAGFIGSNLLHYLVPRHPEHQFINVDALTYAGNLLSLRGMEHAPNYAFERVDLVEHERLAQVFDRWEPELVVHLAAESHVDRSIRGPGAFLRTNIEGTFNLLEECRRRWPRGKGRFHQVSTDEVFGSLGDEGRFSETSRFDPSSPYAATKAAADHLVNAWHRTYGLPVTLTNCSNNYGPFQFPEKLIPLMILHALEGKPLPIYGAGRNVRDWLYVEDHCEAIWAAALRGEPGQTYTVGGDCELRNLEVVEQICHVVAEETGRSAEDLLGLRSYVADRPGHDYRYAVDFSKLRRELGWQPRETFASGLRKTVRWYLDNGPWVDGVRSGSYRTWMQDHYGSSS